MSIRNVFELLMRHYRVYTLDEADRIPASYDLECFGDEWAIREAQQILHGSNIELWEKGRFIARFTASDEKSANPDSLYLEAFDAA